MRAAEPHNAAAGCRDEPRAGRVALAWTRFPDVDPHPLVTALARFDCAHAEQ